MKKPNLGQKQTCKKCEARFFDLNKNPVVCPKCGETFKISKSKSKRAAALLKEESASEAVSTEAVSVAVAPDAPEAPSQDENSDPEAIVATDEAEESEDDLEDDPDDDDLMEDTSDIGEDTDDLSEVLEHVDDGVGDK